MISVPWWFVDPTDRHVMLVFTNTVFPDGAMDYDEIIAWRYTPLA